MSQIPTLDLRQTQSLVMTPQLQQAIKMLQLTNVELSEFVEQELSNNPLLEKEKPVQTEEAPEKPQSSDPSEALGEPDGREGLADVPETGGSLSVSGGITGSGGRTDFSSNDRGIEDTLSDTESLRDLLIGQLHMACDDPKDRMIGSLLIDHIDEFGYIRETADDLADKMAVKADRVARLLSTIRGFEPTGIGAEDLSHCLSIQLSERNRLDPAMQALLDHLDLLASHNLDELLEVCGVDADDLKDMIEEIRSLNPRPAGAYDHFVSQTVVPDVHMKKLPVESGGGWGVELNSDTLPRVLVNETYYTQVCSGAKTKEDKSYLSDRMAAANWLVRALDQRAQTILKVASAIIEEQDAFFNYGIEYLKPLVLRDIAETIAMHESTVSRVTSNKYIETPRGIFELKYFFTTAISATSGGGVHSSESVRTKIKTLVDGEDPKKILSDDKLVALLKEEGIDIARRTVAKYRDALNIPSSVVRRRMKKAQSR